MLLLVGAIHFVVVRARDVPRPKIPRKGKTKNVYLR